ncbi:MAG: DUF4293 domain-containing protein [Prevotellaceae bacterium]|jgi:hypothetical protein|nr:DUF4293 domain-containing protein [Prevotellaceae bacterium]
MIQRIQTFFLFLAGVISGSGIFLDWVNVFSRTQRFVLNFNGFFLENTQPPHLQSHTWGATVFAAAAPLLAFAAIFFFKNRKLQSGICTLAIILIVCFYITLGCYLYVAMQKYTDCPCDIAPAVPAFFSLVALILIALAKKFIKKDEKKVRAWERIR